MKTFSVVSLSRNLELKSQRYLTSLAADISKNIVPDNLGKKSYTEYVEASYPSQITGVKKLLERTTVFYPNKVPLYTDGLHKWRPGCGTTRMWHQLMGESTLSRFDENSKLIVVDGPRCSGKTKLAKDLAKGLNMRYFPEVTNDWLQETTLDGEVLRDWKWNMFTSMHKFYEDPKSACGHTSRLQWYLFVYRFKQYINNILHLLGTGQGVVMEKSPFNNWAEKDALLEMDYMTPRFHAWLGARERWMLEKLMPPHLLIYLDVSAEETYRRIQEYGTQYEKKVDKKYIEAVDKYNRIYLPELNKQFNTVTIQYDWNKMGSSEQVLDDFELLDFSGVSVWDKYPDNELFLLRLNYQDQELIDCQWVNTGLTQPEFAFAPDYSEQYTKELCEQVDKKNWFRRSVINPHFEN